MSEKPTILIVDCANGVETIRELTKDELEARQIAIAEQSAREAAEQAKLDAKASALAKLAALGLTEEEIAAL
jgi:hypothetical protein